MRRPSSRFPAEAATTDTLRQLPAAVPNATPKPSIPRDAVPWVIVPFPILRELALDHRAGFVLSFVDGRTTVETIVDVTGMPAREVVDILIRLVEARAIELRTQRTR